MSGDRHPAAGVTVDTSVVIPALASWHDAHTIGRRACRAVTHLPAHVLLETISVLTRLPRGRAVDVKTAVAVVRDMFPDQPLTLDSAGHASLAERAAATGLHGGQIYDALVAVTAAQHGMQLLSLDRRAEPTYRAIGVNFDLLG